MNITAAYNHNRFRLDMTPRGKNDFFLEALGDQFDDYLNTMRSIIYYVNEQSRIEFYNWSDGLDAIYVESWEMHKAIGILHRMNYPNFPLRYVEFHSEERDHWVELVFAPHKLSMNQKETRVRYYMRKYVNYVYRPSWW